MEQLGWERNMSSFPWSNINHHQQKLEETFIFGSENIFFDPIQHLPKPGSCPLTGLHKGKNVIPVTSLKSLDYTTSPDHNILCHKVFKNFSDFVSSDGSVTKETYDVVDSGYYNGRSRSKKPRSDPGRSITSSAINFQQATESEETDSEVVAQMKEMIYTAAAFRPVSFADDDLAEKPRRKNVRISNDPQTVAARKRRERISERIRVLQKLVPGGDKMDTASMLDEAANYLKFLRSQVKVLEQFGTTTNAYSATQNVIRNVSVSLGVPLSMHAPFLLPHQQIYPGLPPA